MGNKILLRADCHIYPHGSSRDRAIECLNAFEWTYKVAVENDIKVVVDLGDVFHERAHVDSYTHSAAYKIAKKYKDEFGIRTIFILGNHDMYFRHTGEYSSIHSFESLGKVIDKPSKLSIYGKSFDILPYVEKRDGYDGVSGTLVKNFPIGERSDVLLFHCSIENAIVSKKSGMRRSGGTVLSSDVFEEEIDDMVPQELLTTWKYAIGGHYHCPQQLGNIYYVGSPIQHSFGEMEEEKRVMILDVDTMELTSVYNTFSPVFLDFFEGDSVEKYDDNMLKSAKIRFFCDSISNSQVLEAKKSLYAKGVQSVKMCVRNKKIESKESKNQIKMSVSSNISNMRPIIVRYAKLSNELNKKELMDIGLSIVDEQEKRNEK